MLHVPECLETDRLLITRLKYEDAEEIFYAYASKLEATRYVTWPTHQTVRDTRKYLADVIPAWRAGIDFSFSIRLKNSNRLIGSIGALHELGKLQIGYVISPTQWNHGFATEACHALLDQFKHKKEVYRIWSFVDEDNQASMQVLKKAGMIEEARLVNWQRFVNQGGIPKDCILFRYPLDPTD